ncbi:MFS transporter [Falsirhodobacter xinxiangensis]|uniref:MFS transporter n=1 Tax=Falsirhodobacter xinxiangensis TaxID=2530049 RepID=UPI001C703167|nr:MFS transporter [Rhodobacter xinxiangensis]
MSSSDHAISSSREVTDDTKLTPMARRAALSSAFGAALEWIDFAAYGAISATVLPVLFFPAMDPGTAILASFATFGVGFFARPLGGIVFGMLGDRYGRKSILMVTLVLMGVASTLIGAMPTYASIGLWAPTLLVLLRFLQGFALGGEATGAQLLTMEHAPASRRGFFGSLINIGNSLAQVVANAMLFLIAAVLTEEQFMAYGWRIPFLMSVILVFLGVYIRRNVAETPAFKQVVGDTAKAAPRVRLTLGQLLKTQGRTILRLILVWAAIASCFWIVAVFSLGYLRNTLQVDNRTVYMCLMGANMVGVAAVLLGGYISDRVGRKPIFIVSLALMAVMSLIYFPMINTGNGILIFLAMALFIGIMQLQGGAQPAFFAEHFPTPARYAGSAMSYTGANLFFAGPTPFVAAWLLQAANGHVIVITIMCLTLVAISFIATMMSPETRHFDMEREV